MMMAGLAHINNHMIRKKAFSSLDRELLFASARRDSQKEIEDLLAMGASPSCRNGSGATPLIASIFANNKAAFDLLLAASEPSLRDCGGLQAVDIAALTGRIEFLDALLADGRSELSHKEMSGSRHWTPLMHAVAGGYSQCVDLLLPASEPLDITIIGTSALSVTLSLKNPEQAARIARKLLRAEPRLGLILGESQEPLLFHAIRSKAHLVAEALIPYSDLCLRIRRQNALEFAQEHAPWIANIIRAAIERGEIDLSTRAETTSNSARSRSRTL